LVDVCEKNDSLRMNGSECFMTNECVPSAVYVCDGWNGYQVYMQTNAVKYNLKKWLLSTNITACKIWLLLEFVLR
jgi:hypothetical protein